MKRVPRAQYTIGWLCTDRDIELRAAIGMFDEHHEQLSSVQGDSNTYMFGAINGHNVVVACSPPGQKRSSAAAIAVVNMRHSFPSLRYCIAVGTGIGLPSARRDVRLGDVVVSMPAGTYGGFLRYDHGKVESPGSGAHGGRLNVPPTMLLNIAGAIASKHLLGRLDLGQHIRRLAAQTSRSGPRFAHPGAEKHLSSTVKRIRESMTKEQREWRADHGPVEPLIHCGLILCGTNEIRDEFSKGKVREELRLTTDPLCLDHTVATFLDTYPCIVVRGISRYASGDHGKKWQPYAAAAAAAYAKELTARIPHVHRTNLPTY